MKLLISDANILIDLEEGQLLAQFFRLPYDIGTPDILFEEELSEQHPELPGLGLRIMGLSTESMLDVVRLAGTYAAPSRYDCMALALALQEGCPFLTGDQALRAAAQQEHAEVRGTLWVVEELVWQSLLTKDEASKAYGRMEDAGRRLPWKTAHQRLQDLSTG